MNSQPITTSPSDHKLGIISLNLRRFHWGIVLLCFFLPAVEGCKKEIIYPYLKFFNSDSWLQTVIYLYPLIFFLISGLIFRWISSTKRFAVAWSIGYLLLIILSYLLTKMIDEMPGFYCVLLVLLWGVSAFGLLKSRTEDHVINLLGFLLTALALWFFPLVFLFREKILFGGWLYIYANGFILGTYVLQWIQSNKKLTAQVEEINAF